MVQTPQTNKHPNIQTTVFYIYRYTSAFSIVHCSALLYIEHSGRGATLKHILLLKHYIARLSGHWVTLSCADDRLNRETVTVHRLSIMPPDP